MDAFETMSETYFDPTALDSMLHSIAVNGKGVENEKKSRKRINEMVSQTRNISLELEFERQNQ